jgi:hypothetical protein
LGRYKPLQYVPLQDGLFMFWQLLSVGVIVLAATAYLGRRAWRHWGTKKGSCGGSCGCASSAANEQRTRETLIRVEELGVRRRAEG